MLGEQPCASLAQILRGQRGSVFSNAPFVFQAPQKAALDNLRAKRIQKVAQAEERAVKELFPPGSASAKAADRRAHVPAFAHPPEALGAINQRLEAGWQGVKIDGRADTDQAAVSQKPENLCRVIAAAVKDAPVRRLAAGSAAQAWGNAHVTQDYPPHRSMGSLRAPCEKIRQLVRYATRMRTALEERYWLHQLKSPQKGLLRRSAPMVVLGPWPG